ncbi:MAG: alpha/beta fold hydrolase [Pseudomonadota bacterium]
MSRLFFSASTLAATATTTVLSISLLFSTTLSVQAAPASEPVMRPIIAETTIPVQAIVPIASDGTAGEAFLRKPPGDGPFPAVILIHGGAPRWTTEALRDYIVHIHASRFLAAGYVVVAMTRRDLDLELPFAEEQPAVKDAVAVLDYVKDLPYVDPDNVVVRGTSVGGYLTLEVAAARDVAAILVEEPFSFPFVGVNLANGTDQKPDTSKLARINTPILHIQGDQTPNINDFNKDVFMPAVKATGKSLTELTYPGELHSFAFFDNAERTLHPAVSLEAFKQIDKFFQEHLTLKPTPLAANLVMYAPIGM